ncbi:MAG: AI-2E family transporter [Solirubrobacteraceae bacterium]
MRFRLFRRFSAGPRSEEQAPEEPTLSTPVASTQGSAPGAGVPRVVVPRWIQLVLLPLALVGLWTLARAAGTVLLIFVAASTIALILNPVARMLQRRGIPRGLAILLIYVGMVAALFGIGVFLANTVSTQVANFQHNLPSIIRHANHDLTNFQNWLNDHGIHVQIKAQGQTALQTLEHDVSKNSGSILSLTRDLLGQALSVAFDLVLVAVLSIYLLVYGPRIGTLVRRIMPPGDGTPGDDYPLLVQRAVFGYVRGQLLFSLIMGTSAALALWIIGTIGIFPDGAHYALFFGAFYGVMELIPYIGPILGALPAVLVALFTDPITALWVALLFVGLQQLEGHVVAPQVFRISLRINPILVILSLLIGFQLYGIAGALVALPVAAVLRETALYLRRHLVLEPWGTSASPGLGLTGDAAPQAKQADGAGEDSKHEEVGEAEVPGTRDETEPLEEPDRLGESEALTEADVPIRGYRVTRE